MYKLIKGTDLTNKQKQLLKFVGMNNPSWVLYHSFYFTADGNTPAPIDSGFYYPVAQSFKFLPY
jgi:hypothetical protein